MKSPKLKIITMAILVALSQNTFANEEFLPYTLSLKYINETASVETLILSKNGERFVSKNDFQELYGKSIENIQTIRFEDEEYFPLDKLGKLTMNEQYLSAVLTPIPALLPSQYYSLNSRNIGSKPTFEAGQHFNYDLQYDQSSNLTSVDLSHNFSNATGNYGEISTNINTTLGLSLIEAQYTIRDSEKNTALRIGTGYTGYSELNNSFRFAGVQYSSNHDLDPYFSDRVTNVFSGTAEIEGTAELYLNGNKILQQQIRPGDYSIDGLHNPMTTTGEAKLIIRDINENIKSVSQPLVGSPRNLKEGLSHYSFETGLLRPDYNKLSDAFISGNYAYGVSDRLSVGGHVEATKEVTNISGYGLLATDYGTFKLGASVGEGSILNAGYYLSTKDFNANIDYKKYNQYRGIASSFERNENVLSMNGSWKFMENKNLNFSFVKTKQDQYLSLGTTFSIANGVSLSTTISRSNISGTSAFVGLVFSLDKVKTTTSYDSRNETLTSEFRSDEFEINKPQYIGTVNHTPNSNFYTGAVILPTQYGDVGLLLAQSKEVGLSSRLTASGAIVLSGDDLNLSRKINSSYVIVDAKEKDISINTNSGYKGTTGSNGKLIYPTASFYEQKIFIDPQDYVGDKSPQESTYEFNVNPKSPKTISVNILTPGFYLSIPIEKEFIKLKGKKYYKTSEGYYIDEIVEGNHTFTIDNISYTFNTSEVNSDNVVFVK
jgi:outer membrane usher protein